MIYLDHAAATPVRRQVVKTMQPYFSNLFANPSSMHDLGKKSNDALETSRKTIKKILAAKEQDKIVFTSGGTESVNLALQGVAGAKKKGHIITSVIEHKAVLETCKYLETQAFKVTYLSVDKQGIVNAKDVEKAIRKNTILISIMFANNEIGTLEPIKQIAKIAKKHGILFHSDACQAPCYCNLQNLGVDLLTLNSSKCYGPKGVGLLYVRNGVELEPLLFGGAQEYGLRSGTQNVPGIVGFSKALEMSQKERVKESKRVTELRNWFISEIKKNIKNVTLNGHKTKRLPNNINLSFGVDSQTLVNYLNQEGICASTGSACTANEIETSHVLQAIGSKEGIRFSLGKSTTKKDLREVVKKLKVVVESLRRL